MSFCITVTKTVTKSLLFEEMIKEGSAKTMWKK
jgi:hypothetical protein